MTGLFFGILVLVLTPRFPIHFLSGETYQQNASLPVFAFYLLVSTTCARFKYYFAWKLSESHLNCCGFGLDGSGKKWDLVSNIDITAVEVFPFKSELYGHRINFCKSHSVNSLASV